MRNLFLLLLVSINLTLHAQGGILITSMTTSPDAFTFVILGNIPDGTVINFTDNGLTSTGSFITTEGLASYTVPAGGGTCGTSVTGSIGTMALANANDQVFAYTGTLASPMILGGISSNAPITTGAPTSNQTYTPSSGFFMSGIGTSTFYTGPATPTNADLTNSANYSTTGPATTITSCANLILTAFPVSLMKFNAVKVDKSNTLTFTTATEQNNSHFEIERSADGRNFAKIGEVEGAGTTTDEQNYKFVDENPLKGINYYRLKQVDFNGQFEYSKVVSVRFGKTGTITVIPTLVLDQINVEMDEAGETDGTWQVFDLNGRQVLTGVISADNARFTADMSSLQEGTYVVRVQMGDQAMTERVQKL